jgi:hypothetical protein
MVKNEESRFEAFPKIRVFRANWIREENRIPQSFETDLKYWKRKKGIGSAKSTITHEGYHFKHTHTPDSSAISRRHSQWLTRFALQSWLALSLSEKKMKKIIAILLTLAVLFGIFIWGFSLGKDSMQSTALKTYWADAHGLTEEETEKFIERTKDLEITPEALALIAVNTVEFTDATAEMLRNNTGFTAVISLAILKELRAGDLKRIEEICIERVADYYKKDSENQPPLLKQGSIHLKEKIEEEAQLTPKLMEAIRR